MRPGDAARARSAPPASATPSAGFRAHPPANASCGPGSGDLLRGTVTQGQDPKALIGVAVIVGVVTVIQYARGFDKDEPREVFMRSLARVFSGGTMFYVSCSTSLPRADTVRLYKLLRINDPKVTSQVIQVPGVVTTSK